MKDLFKVLFLGLLMSISFTACLDEDSDNDGKVDKLAKIENFSVSIGSDPYSNLPDFLFSWTGIPEAYSYQVLYRAEGTSEWKSSNVYIPSPNTPGETMTKVMMAGFARGVVYEVQIVAHRDSRDLIIGESDTIKSPKLPLREGEE